MAKTVVVAINSDNELLAVFKNFARAKRFFHHYKFGSERFHDGDVVWVGDGLDGKVYLARESVL